MRPCLVLPPLYDRSIEVIKGLFHQWVPRDTSVFAIVEKQDGKMIFVDFYRIKFTDDEFDNVYSDDKAENEETYEMGRFNI